MNIILSCQPSSYIFIQQLETADAADKPAQASGIECFGSSRDCATERDVCWRNAAMHALFSHLEEALRSAEMANMRTTRCDHK